MAVDLPVPVVPMSLKCLVSSATAMAIPARVSSVGFDLFTSGAAALDARPSTSTTPRLYVSRRFGAATISRASGEHTRQLYNCVPFESSRRMNGPWLQ